VYAIGCERGVHFYAMEFIEGRTLADVIRGRAGGVNPPVLPTIAYVDDHQGVATPRAPEPTAPVAALSTEYSGPRDRAFYRRAADLIAQAADALEHAHALGIVHRDVKPGNLLLDGAGKLYVSDFGLARFGPDVGLTMSGDLLGTLRYMSPEQALAKHGLVDHRTDIYSLGATLYELLTLTPAVDGADKQEVLQKIAFEEPTPPRKRDKAVPPELEIITLKCLAKDPAERYATAGELADDLRRFLADQPIRAKRPTVRQRLARLARRHPGATAALALIAGLLLAGAWALDRETTQADTAARAVTAEAAKLQAQGRYPEAKEVARRAVALLPRFGGDAALRRDIEERATDLDFLYQADEIRLEQAAAVTAANRFDNERAVPLYRQAFLDYGVNVLAGDEAAVVASLRARSIHTDLAAALDEWSRIAGDTEDGHRLERLADAIDPAGIIGQVRKAARAHDVEALRRLAAGLSDDVPPQVVARFARAFYEVSAITEAEQLLRAGLRKYPGDFWLNHWLGIALHQPDRAAEGLTYRRVCLALRPHSPGVWLNFGGHFQFLNRNEEADAAYRRAIELKPDYASAYNNLGVTLWNRGRATEAEAAYRRALDLDPNNTDALTNLGGILVNRGQPQEALPHLYRVIELNGRHDLAHCFLGIALTHLNRPQEGLAPLRKAIQINPQQGNAYSGLGLALMRLGQVEDAIAAYRKAIELSPERAGVHYDLGVALSSAGQAEQAIAAYREAIKWNPNFAEAHTNLGGELVELQRPQEALPHLERAVKLNPQLVPAHENLGAALIGSNRAQDALVPLRQAITLNPNSAGAYFSSGKAWSMLGRYDKAVVAIRRASELKPNGAVIHYYLGHVLVNAGGSVEEAETAYRRAIQINPNFAEAHCNLGIVLRAQGRLAESLKMLRRGHELGSRQPN
jgi:tetratricopeptide (TPR) repeat protein